jgi:hypothetical protein
MNARKHLAGFAVFSLILGSAILINHFLTIPYATIAPVLYPETARVTVREQQPVTYRVRQVSLDYVNQKSYTELSLFRQLGQPAPETIWVTTTYFSPDSTRAEDWTTVTEIRQPFARGNWGIFVATAEWELPPAVETPGAGYFARVYVSSESQGNFYPPDYQSKSDLAQAVPVVVHWPDNKSVSAVTAKKFSR